MGAGSSPILISYAPTVEGHGQSPICCVDPTESGLDALQHLVRAAAESKKKEDRTPILIF